MNKEDSFYKDGLKFSCKMCSYCCRAEPGFVYLSRKDLDRFLKVTNAEENEFIEKYCRWVPYYDGKEVLCLKEMKNYDCIFWNNGCSAYAARPLQCSTYPFWDFLLRSPKTWNEEAKSCPGMNNGELHSFEEITEKLIEYRNNKPLSKQEFENTEKSEPDSDEIL